MTNGLVGSQLSASTTTGIIRRRTHPQMSFCKPGMNFSPAFVPKTVPKKNVSINKINIESCLNYSGQGQALSRAEERRSTPKEAMKKAHVEEV